MGLLRGTARAVLKGRQAAVAYLLNAPFTADNQGFADAQVLDTAAEGVTAGQLTVVEVDGTLAIVSNACAFTAQSSPTGGDLGLYGPEEVKTLGKALLQTVNLDTNTKANRGALWFSGADLALNWTYGFQVGNIYMKASENGWTDYRTVLSYSAATDYQLCVVLGGYDVNGVPWRSGETAADYLYGAAWYIKGGAFTNWTLLWRSAWGNDTPLRPAFENYHQAGTIDSFRVPDSDLSAVLQPTCLSLYGSNGELDAYTPDLGGGWTEDIGDWDTAGGILTATGLGIATFTGLADCIYDTEITMPAAGTVAGGLVLRGSDYTGASEDYWYIKCTPATAGNDFEIIEYAAGAATQRAVTDVDFSAATAYNIRAICDTQQIDAFAAGGDKISYGSAASGQAATDFGLRDEGNGNMTFDKTVLHARTSAVYESTFGAV